MKKIIIITLIIIGILTLPFCPGAGITTKTTADSSTYWKDRFGTEHITRLAADANAVHSKRLLDSVKARIGNKVQTITAVGATTAGTITPQIDTIYLQDSTVEYNFRYHDQWLSLDGTLGKSPLINYRIEDSIIISTYRKNRQTYIDAYSLNPNVHLTGITGLHIADDKQTRFAIGPYIGYGFTRRGGAPTIGIALQYSIIKF